MITDDADSQSFSLIEVPQQGPVLVADAKQVVFCDSSGTAELLIDCFDFAAFDLTAVVVGCDPGVVGRVRADAEVFVVTSDAQLLDPVTVATLLGREVRCHSGTMEKMTAEEIESAIGGAPTVHPVTPELSEATPYSAPVADLETPRVDAYYDSGRKEFLLRNGAGRWLSHTSQQFRMLMRVGGTAITRSEAERLLTEIIDTKDVAYTGRLAGYQAGFYASNGVRQLITESPKILTPILGDWPTIGRLIKGLLGQDAEFGSLQLTALKYWLRSGYEAVSAGKWRAAQILALAGPVNCGKSLLQRVITECLGGRSADAFRYLSGGTHFNRELFGAEHLTIDDAQISTDYRIRLQMAGFLKELAVGRDHSCHAKGRDAVNLRPIWRCSISLNDEGECLLVLPPLRADIRDKVHLLRCQAPSEPFPTETPMAMAKYWDDLVSECPAFLFDCCRTEPPEGYLDSRFGMRAFHHPAIVLALEEQAPELVLLELLDLELWSAPLADDWEGTARELEMRLLALDSKVREQARRILSWPQACGTFLGRLAKSCPDRVAPKRSSQKRAWIIKEGNS